MPRPIPTLALLILLIGPAFARAGGGIALMGLRPGMTEGQVLAALRPQTSAISRAPGACRTGHEECARNIAAQLPDGRITVSFMGRPARAWRIRLRMDAAGPNLLRRAAQARFGPPIRPGALLWCPAGTTGACATAGARLRLRRSKSGGGVLSLSDPSLRPPDT